MKKLIFLLIVVSLTLSGLSQTIEEYIDRGNSLLEQQKYYEAIDEYLKAFEMDSNNGTVIYNLALAHYFLGEYGPASDFFDKAIETYPEAETYFYRGLSYYNLGKYKEASEDFSKCLEINPQNEDAQYNLDLCMNLIRDPETPIENMPKPVQPNNDDRANLHGQEMVSKEITAEDYLKSGNVKYEQEDLEGAINDYDKAIEMESNYEDAYYFRGYVKYELEKYNEALIDFERALEIDPNDPENYYMRGLTNYYLGKYQESRDDFSKCLEMNPQNEDAKYNMDLCIDLIYGGAVTEDKPKPAELKNDNSSGLNN